MPCWMQRMQLVGESSLRLFKTQQSMLNETNDDETLLWIEALLALALTCPVQLKSKEHLQG